MGVIRSMCRYVLAAAIAMPVCAEEQPDVRIERQEGVFAVSVEVPVSVDALTAWQVLTDYNRLADFVPDMKVSRVVSKAGARVLLEQQGEIGLLMFRMDIRVMLEVDEIPPERITFRAVGGNVKRMQGEWRLRRDGPMLWLSYQAEIEPDIWVPPLIGSAVLRANVERQVSGVAQEMRRRYVDHAAAGAATDR